MGCKCPKPEGQGPLELGPGLGKEQSCVHGPQGGWGKEWPPPGLWSVPGEDLRPPDLTTVRGMGLQIS